MSVKVEWLCSRCADLEGKETETDPVLLRLCTSCKVENYVRPFGHAGEDAFASEEEKAAAHAKASEEAKVMRAAREKVIEDRKEEASKEIAEAKEEVVAGVNYTSEVGEIEAETVEAPIIGVVIPDENGDPILIKTPPEAEPEPSKPLEKMTKAELLEELKKHG